MAPRHAAQLGPFILEALLGRGAMGQVWRARHCRTNQPVAIKLLPEQADTERTAFLREVQAIARLDHPGVLQVFDYGFAEGEIQHEDGTVYKGAPWFAMELALRSVVPADFGYWTPLEDGVASILEALAHCHARHVIHRDLKPDNLLWVQAQHEVNLKLGDFGVSALDVGIDNDADGHRADAIGTPLYMAPEQIRGEWRKLGPWTDIYALGCVTWQLLTGSPPFTGGDVRQIVRKQLLDAPPAFRPRLSVPDGVEDWLRQALQKDPQDRFRFAAEARRRWQLLQDHEQSQPEKHSTTLDTTDGGLSLVTGELHADELSATVAVAEPAPPLSSTDAPQPGSTTGNWTGSGPGGPGLLGLREPPLVGRDAEQELLRSVLQEVEQSGKPRAILISGQVGTGKTTLARWLQRQLHESGVSRGFTLTAQATQDGIARMLETWCHTFGLDRPAVFERIQDIAEDWLSSESELDAAALTEVIRPAGIENDVVPRVKFQNPGERRAAVLQFLEAAAGARPLVVIADDAERSHDALALVCEGLSRAAPLLFVVNIESDHVGEGPRQTLLNALGAHELCTGLKLGPLGATHARELLSRTLGLSSELASDVVQRVGGNPLFALQTVGDLARRGLLVPGFDGLGIEGRQIPVAASIRELWQNRLDAVLNRFEDRNAQLTVLELGAALGGTVDYDEWEVLCAALDVHPNEELLDSLSRRNMIALRDDGWSFSHELLRESVAARSRHENRLSLLHRHIARLLPDLDRRPGHDLNQRLGRHWAAAGEWARAVPILLQAGRRAIGVNKLVLGHQLLDEAELALDRLSSRDPAALESSGSTIDSSGSTVDSPDSARDHSHLDRVPQVSPHPEVSRWRARAALLRMWGHELANELDQAAQTAALARTRIQEAKSEVLKARLLRQEAALELRLGHVQAGQEKAAKALDLFRSLDDVESQEIAEAYQVLASLTNLAGELEKAAELFVLAREAFQESQDPIGEGNALHGLADVRRRQHRIDDAVSAFVEAVEVLETAGSRISIAWCLNGRGELERHEGRLDEAESFYRQALALFGRIGMPPPLLPRLNLVLVWLERRNWDEARQMLQDALPEVEAAGRTGYLAILHLLSLAPSAAEGDWNDFDVHLHRATSLLEQTGIVDPDVARPFEIAAEACALGGSPGRARSLWMQAAIHWELLGNKDRATSARANRDHQTGPQ